MHHPTALPRRAGWTVALLSVCTAAAAAQGGALRFDGVDDLATAVDLQGDFNVGSSLTIEAWVQVDVAQPGGGFVGARSFGGGTSWILGGGLPTATDAIMAVSTPNTDAVFFPNGVTPGPAWNHYAGTFDGTLLTLFINGVQVAQSPHGTPGSASAAERLVIGAFPNTNSLYFAGTIDEVRVWNVVRTEAAIQADYQLALTGSEPGLVGYYRFDEGSGDVILDSSSRGNDGTLGDTPGPGPDDPTRVQSGAPISGGGGLGTTYCTPAVANSTGAPATIRATGAALAASNDVTLEAADLPANAFGFFLTSTTQGMTVNPGGSQGTLCLGGSIGRYVGPGQIQNSGPAGAMSLALDLTTTPQPTGSVSIAAGETWNFQGWYRDSVGGSATSNFTDAVEIAFL